MTQESLPSDDSAMTFADRVDQSRSSKDFSEAELAQMQEPDFEELRQREAIDRAHKAILEARRQQSSTDDSRP